MKIAPLRLLAGLAFVLMLTSNADCAPINLVPNGDFELGNTQFGSDYTYSPSANTTESQYTVRTNPYPWNPNFISTGDHTTGTGSLFVGNGAPVDQRVWFSSGISVTPHTNYYFEAFAINVDAPTYEPGTHPEAFAVLSFYANGSLLGTRTTSTLGVWQGLSTHWNSGTATTVDLEIRNSNFAVLGNDFGIDDISLSTASTVQNAVPEPSTLSLGALATLAGACGLRWRRLRRPRASRNH